MSLPATKSHHAPVYQMPTRSHDFSTLRRQARHDDDLSHQARHLFEDICELSEKTGECKAGDKHFAEAFGTTRRTVRRWVAELKDAGYITVTGATVNRRLTPTAPAPEAPQEEEEDPDLGHGLGQLSVLSGGDLGHDLGHSEGADLGHPVVDTKSIYTPEREERGARAHVCEGKGSHLVTAEDPIPVAVYVSRCNRRPTSMQGYEIAQAIGSDPSERELAAWIFVCERWAATHEPGSKLPPYRLEDHRKMVRAYREELTAAKGTDGGGEGRLVTDRYGAPLDLSRDIPASEVPAVLAAYPGMTADDFADRGKGDKGQPMKRLSLDWRQKLGVSK